MRGLLSKFWFCVLVLGFSLQLVQVARSQEAEPPWCSGEQLDLNLGPRGGSPNSNAHWLSIEIRNRGASDCKLQPLSVGFPPDDISINDIFDNADFKDTSQAAATFRARSRRLGPGEEVHVAIAWISVPFEVRGMTLDDCRSHDELTVYAMGAASKPLLDVRNVRMWSCDNTFWRTSYRLGPYTTTAPISKDWLDRVHLHESDFAASDRGVQEQRATGDTGVKLWALSDVQYLKGTTPGSGYFGVFGLFLRFSAPGFPTCPFRSLRKREADGQTTVFLNLCEDNAGQKRVGVAMKEVSLLPWVFGLLPERTGKVEYDVVSEVVQNGRPELVTNHLDLSVRDPNKPTLPTIDANGPECESAQLKLTSPVMKLGTHWDLPMNYPAGADTDDWVDGKVFEVTNTSAESCLVGGIPNLKFSDARGAAPMVNWPPLCRNCQSPVFKPRESRWIELQPNDSAHFFVVRDISHIASYGCSTTRGIDLSLAGGQPMHLPFEAGYCTMTVSAWRSGKYDGDPMNIQYDAQEAGREQRWLGTTPPSSSKVACIDYSKLASALPPPTDPQCEQEEFAKNGRPTMSPASGGVAFGVSSTPGQPASVHVWIDNQTDDTKSYYMCCGTTFLDAIDVYDSGGHRLLTKSEQSLRKTCAEGQEVVRACTCSTSFSIAPHTLRAVDSGSVEQAYELPPGRYFVTPSVVHRYDCESLKKSLAEASKTEPRNAILIVIPE